MNRILCLLLATAAGLGAPAQTGAAGPVSVKPPAYPRINLATSFEVDASWPQRPPDIGWAAVPGIAVDKQDNDWIFTRTNPTVQVYAPDGRYLFGWQKEKPFGCEKQGKGLREIRLQISSQDSPGGEMSTSFTLPAAVS